MYGFIYETTNNINGKKYIGQKKYDKRGNWKSYLGSGVILQKAIEKHGAENFSKRIIEECQSKEDLDIKERYWINFYDAVNSRNYYNIASGGDGGNTIAGYTKAQMREHSLKQSKSKRGIINLGANNPAAKKVICLNNMKIFNTTIEASKYANVTDYGIQQCCSSKSQLHTCGEDPITKERLQWAYYEEGKVYSYEKYKRTIFFRKRVICLETKQIFDSIKDAAFSINRTQNCLSAHLHKATKYCGLDIDKNKLHWEFIE
ncbi:GIY-YIG nuclease family protein [Lacrimispora indolis]|uniref:GIY-YIG nuclease family protein n=1 Tax=Lacrimispora indolis TaxID=69825 RepID=UPI0004134361|nr:GIY-YIG nuclease family protein [[Clostridium] methoxybenzovorans]